MKEENFDNDEIINIVNEIVEGYRTVEDLRNDHPEEIKFLEDALLNYLGENDLKILKTGFPDKWKDSTKKLAYRYEQFKSIDDYQNPVDNLKKEFFFSKLKNGYPDDEEIERTKVIFKDSI